ncbi:phosphomannomutase CpsG [Brumicola blandensis]|jgi:phosphomannomutase|uniref:phosphomannomutase n=1 Tax=Brumicola blandensis TaxID=3075611 RepID=A0AAW8R0K0_9ALTE|nr:phosphomannomutase CpsG [Alteromonas sp. W409]MDT0581738.1 phosphomannomutase CpsG [Alteromonas sp. W409]
MTSITCFKAYDIRGELIEQLTESVAYRIGRAFAEELQTRTVVVGADVRKTSIPLKLALSAGLLDGGAKVLDIGMAGTEEIYFATKHLGVDGGIEVTASHNPINYNGMKLVKSGSVPISGDSGLFAIRDRAQTYDEMNVQARMIAYSGAELVSDKDFLEGSHSIKEIKLLETRRYERVSCVNDYVLHLSEYIDYRKLKPIKLVVNAGNGAAGPALDAIELFFQHQNVPVEFVKVHHQADGNFPNGIPNPLLPENRADTADAVLAHKADMGIAWDGDFDRCFLFDEQGEFVEGYYIVGLLAQAFLAKEKGASIIYDPRVYWNTEEIVKTNGGKPIKSKTGHAFIKERMRKEDAVYGGEMSAHHYFRDFAYCDSGMIPWMLVAELISASGKPLSMLVKERIAAFPSSGEINSTVENAGLTIKKVVEHYQDQAEHIDKTDGIGMEFGSWRFNLRKSNTEPVIRLNVESKGDIPLMKEKTAELMALITA